jgi:hypothetical protein
VARFAPAAFVAVLLLATGAAFAYAEKLKLTRSPIFGTQVENKVFSPVCECPSDVTAITFRLREADRMTVEIVRAGEVVRELVRNRPEGRGRLLVVWDGRDDAGRVVAEGTYRPRVRLLEQRRTITLPNPIRVDVTRPVVERMTVRPRLISPDGDGRRDRVRLRYALSEPAQVSLYVDGVQRGLKRGRQTEGVVEWNGRIGGRPVRKGSYALTLGARDLAGNAARRPQPRAVLVRYVALGRDRIQTRVGARFAVLVLTDARRVEWRLGARSGTARRGTLRLRAPLVPGRFTLTVTANGNAARAAVLVQGPES